MIAAMVVPPGWLSNSMTACCLEFGREGEIPRPALLAIFLADRLTRGLFGDFEALRDIVRSLRLRRHRSPSPPRPRNGCMASGVGSRGARYRAFLVGQSRSVWTRSPALSRSSYC